MLCLRPMRIRATVTALPLVPALLLVTAVAIAAAGSCGGGDDDTCNGRILTTCSECTCAGGQTATCTAWPKGDTNSNERCCECN